MADQVTISTFLELRDNLSPGLNRVADLLRGIHSASGVAVSGLSRVPAPIEAASRSADHMAASVRRVAINTSAMNNALRMAMGAVTAVFGFRAIKAVVNVNREFENLNLRIAGTLRAFNLAPTFSQAQAQSEKVLNVLREMAAKLPGEAEEYAGAFTTALPKLIASGMTDLTKAADFVSRYTAVAISNSVDAAQAGRDLMLMLSGRAGLQVKTFVALSDRIGMTAKDFNKLGAEVRRQKIEQAISVYDDQLKAAGDTFDAKFGEMKSTLKDIVRLANAPLFAGAKTVLVELNKYLKENKQQLVITAQVIARDFLAALKRLPEIVKTIGDRLAEIWDYTKLIVKVWAGFQLINGLTSVLRIYTQIRDVVLAISAANVGAGAISTITATSAASDWMRAGGGAAATAMAAKMTVGQIMVVGATTVVFAAAAAAMFAESIGEFAKAGTGMRVGQMGLADWEKTQFGTGIKRQLGQVVSEFDTKTMRSAREELIYKGKYINLEEQLAKARYGTLPTYEREQGRAGLISELDALREMYKQSLVSPLVSAKDDVIKFAESMGVSLDTLREASARANIVPAAPTAPADRSKINYDFSHSNFNIKQEFAEGFDPDRIAFAFANDLGRLADMKLQAAYSLTPGSVR